MNISLVLPVYNRDPSHLERLLVTTRRQFLPFYEVIVVDASTDPALALLNRKACGYHAFYIPTTFPLNFPRMYNVGIKATDVATDVVACTNVDMLFDRNFTWVLSKLMDEVGFARSQAAILPEDTNWEDFGTDEHWKYLLSIARRRYPLGLGVLCASRDWWFHVRGFDESLSGGLGVYDGDVRKRAQKHGLKMGYTPYEDARVLHQWHPKSSLKHHNQLKKDDDPEIVKNPDAWGELEL